MQLACLNGWFDGQPGPGYSGAGLNFFMGCDVLARRVFIILLVLLFPLSLCVSASSGSVVYGETVEQGTGDKSPDNPYSLTGYLPEEFRFSGTIYGVPLNEPLYGDGIVNDEYDAATGVEIRRWKTLVLDGSEKFFIGTTDNGYYFGFDLSSVDPGFGSLNLYCTHFPVKFPTRPEPCTYMSLQGYHLIFFMGSEYADVDTVDKFKSYLSLQSSLGTPVSVIFQLEKPVAINHEPVVLGKYMPESILDSLGWMVQRVVSVIGMVTVSPLLLLGLAMWAAGGAIALFRRVV